jgi:hypothetical protein
VAQENEPRGRKPERGAAEEAAGTPLTETEARANTRPPSKPENAGRGDGEERGGKPEAGPRQDR